MATSLVLRKRLVSLSLASALPLAFVATVHAAPPRASAQVQLTIVDGQGSAARTTRYRVPLPTENSDSQLRLLQRGDAKQPAPKRDVQLKIVHQVAGPNGAHSLRYEVSRGIGAASEAEVHLTGSVPLEAAEAHPVVLGELGGTDATVTVSMELVK